MKKQKDLFKLPVVKTAGGDLTKLWYVEYFFLNPSTNQYKAFRVSGNANRCTTAEGRIKALDVIRKRIRDKIVVSGWNPFGLAMKDIQPEKYFTVIDAIEYVLALKKGYQRDTSYPDTLSRNGVFKDWLLSKRLHRLMPAQIKTSHIMEFLLYTSTVRKCQNRTRNNYLVEISSVFQQLKNMRWIPENVCDGIKKIPNRSESHIPFNRFEVNNLSKWMREYDPFLLSYCKFIIMGLRPCEIVKLKVGDINLEEGYIKLREPDGKVSAKSIKAIFAKYIPDLQDMRLEQYPQSFYLFTAKGKPGSKPTTRDYFTNRFKTVKEAFGFDKTQSMYALRHTTAIELLKNGADMKEIMGVTGHKTLAALQAYLQKYLDEPPKDVSSKLKFDF